MRSTRFTNWVVYLRFEEMTVIMLAFSPCGISRLFLQVVHGETEKVSACIFPLPFPSYVYMCYDIRFGALNLLLLFIYLRTGTITKYQTA